MELVYVSVISGLFMLTTVLLLNMNWYKRENFKIHRDNIKAENKLKIEKVRREMGLGKMQPVPIATADNNPLSSLSSLAPLLKNLSPEQLSGLAEAFLGNSEDTGGGGAPESLGDMISEFAANNPDIVKGFLQGVTGQKDKNPPLY